MTTGVPPLAVPNLGFTERIEREAKAELDVGKRVAGDTLRSQPETMKHRESKNASHLNFKQKCTIFIPPTFLYRSLNPFILIFSKTERNAAILECFSQFKASSG
jgi:hypothetical protein